MGSESPDSVAEAACAIMDYLTLHPRSEDSPRGICSWWLDDRFDRPTVVAALDHLTETGALRRRILSGGSPLYSVARHS